MSRYFRLFFLMFKLNVSKKMIYSTNFWVGFITDIVYFILQIATFHVIFTHVSDIGGWNAHQVMFFIGTFIILDSICMTVYFFGLMNLPNLIRTGGLDLFVVKPVNTQFLVSISNVNFSSIFNAIFGVVVVVYSASRMGIDFSLLNVTGYVLLLGVSSLIYYSLIMCLRTVAFWVIRMDSLLELEGELINFSSRIPGVVYQGVLRAIFLVLLPYGLLATIPTRYFTESLNPEALWPVFVIAAVYIAASVLLWRAGMKKYSSASS